MTRTTRLQPLTVAEVLDLPVMFPVWPTLGQVLDTGKTATYELAKKNELPVPVVKVGRLLRARRSDVIAFLGLEDSDAAGAATPTAPAERTSDSTVKQK